jgi:hypothetical protein
MKTYLISIASLLILTSCGTTFHPFNRKPINDKFNSLGGHIDSAKSHVSALKSNAQRIDDKTVIILKHWDDEQQAEKYEIAPR